LPPTISSPPANEPASSLGHGPASSPPKEPANSPGHGPANSPAADGSSDGTASPPTYLFPPKETSLRRFPPKLIINLNETPCPSNSFNVYTYNWKRVTIVAGRFDRNGWNKRQAIIILHIMANNDTPFKPVIIFNGQRIVLAKEQPYYNLRVKMHFNPTVYHNEEMFLQWLENVYQPYITKNAYNKEESLMIMDAAAFYKTPAVIKFIYEA
jgi:hypothetical protein